MDNMTHPGMVSPHAGVWIKLSYNWYYGKYRNIVPNEDTKIEMSCRLAAR